METNPQTTPHQPGAVQEETYISPEEAENIGEEYNTIIQEQIRKGIVEPVPLE